MAIARAALASVLLLCDPLVRVSESWGIGDLGIPFLQGGNATCPAGKTCPAKEGKGGGIRGVPSRPKPEPQQGWKWPLTFSWLLKISLRLISDAASSNLEYCGTLCASIGLAARWSYWPKWVGPRGREE